MNNTKQLAFTLVELIIVVSILGILAAIVLPEVQGHTQQARESAAKDNLRLIRNAIEQYKLNHNGVTPGYSNGSPLVAFLIYPQFIEYSNVTGDTTGSKTGAYIHGPYISEIPENPFNGKTTFELVTTTFPDPFTGTTGWYYKASTGEIRLNYPGTDSKGTAYSSY